MSDPKSSVPFIRPVYPVGSLDCISPLQRRSEVELIFGWIVRWCRLSLQNERRIDVITAIIHVAIGDVLLQKRPSVTSQSDSNLADKIGDANSDILAPEP